MSEMCEEDITNGALWLVDGDGFNIADQECFGVCVWQCSFFFFFLYISFLCL